MKTMYPALVAVAVAALSACGGDDGTATPAPTPTLLTLTGTAATGAAIAGGTVAANCASGTSATATTSDAGTFTLTVTEGALPCALRVTAPDGTVLHSVQPGAGGTGSFTVNITPLTEMIVASATGVSPADFFGSVGPATNLPASAVTEAVANVRTALSGVVDLGAMNPLSDPLVAATPTSAGNELDQKIDAAMAALKAANLNVAAVTTAIAANPKAPDVVKAELQPVAAGCSRARSGSYRMVNPAEPDPKWQAHVLKVDVSARSVTDQDNATTTFDVVGAPSDCRYKIVDADGTVSSILVSSGGLLVVHSESGSQRSVTIGLPEQTLPIAEIAGTWNMAVWSIDSVSGFGTPEINDATIDATGNVTLVRECPGLGACVEETTELPKFVANVAKGGFDLVLGDLVLGRAFAYKSLSGERMAILLLDDGSFLVMTPKRPAAAPTVDASTRYWEFLLQSDNSISALSEDVSLTTAFDAATKTATRLRASDQRMDTVTLDKPRDGWRYRAQNSCSIGGKASSCSEAFQLPLPGMGITLALGSGSSVSTRFLSVSVGRP